MGTSSCDTEQPREGGGGGEDPWTWLLLAWEVMSVFPWWAVRRQLVTTVLLMTEQRLTP